MFANLHRTHNIPYLLAFLTSTLLYLWYGFVSDVSVSDLALSFHREQARSGSWWQWISAHFMHTNFFHYALNMIGLALLWILHAEYASVKSFGINFLVLALGISLGIYYFSPTLTWYVGMSGVLHGIFAWGIVIDLYRKRKSGYLLLIGLVIKLVNERFFASSTFMAELIEAGVAIDAHLYGAVIGLGLGVINVIYDRHQRAQNCSKVK